MKIIPDVFEAFLKCPTKAWLRAAGEPASGNAHSEWVKTQAASYRATGFFATFSEKEDRPGTSHRSSTRRVDRY
jgi:hypothetical protein